MDDGSFIGSFFFCPRYRRGVDVCRTMSVQPARLNLSEQVLTRVTRYRDQTSPLVEAGLHGGMGRVKGFRARCARRDNARYPADTVDRPKPG